MKPAFYLVSSIVLIAACRKKDDTYNNTNNTSSVGYFKFKSNGALIELNKYVDVNDNKTTTALVLGVSAQSESSANKVFGGVVDFNGTGAYVFETSLSSYILFTINGTVYTLGKGLQPKSHGTLTVTEIKETTDFTLTKGTFSGVAYASATDSVVITDGEYRDRNF